MNLHTATQVNNFKKKNIMQITIAQKPVVNEFWD